MNIKNSRILFGDEESMNTFINIMENKDKEIKELKEKSKFPFSKANFYYSICFNSCFYVYMFSSDLNITSSFYYFSCTITLFFGIIYFISNYLKKNLIEKKETKETKENSRSLKNQIEEMTK